jgi:S1-C subfamily serine protease
VRNWSRLYPHKITGVFRIRAPGGQGTAFIVSDGKKSVLVTAKHIWGNTKCDDKVYLYWDDWVPFQVYSFSVTAPLEYDVVLFTLVGFVVPRHRNSFGAEPFFLGDKLVSIGFPLGMVNVVPGPTGELVAHEKPLPMVKVGYFSGYVKVGEHTLLISDCQTNVGFSGGPVYNVECGSGCCLMGVNSSYAYDAPTGVSRRSPSGEPIDTEFFVRPNSGFSQIVPVQVILTLFQSFEDSLLSASH